MLELVEHEFRVRQQRPAVIGEADPFRRADEQRQALARLQLAQRPCDGGLRQAERTCRPANAARLRARDERLQLMEFHGDLPDNTRLSS